MAQPYFTLHHYELSPFAEKIRCMFGYCDMSWNSAITSPMPPRELVDPLAGGYRRIPVMQVGADIFCDTRIITSEIASISGKPELAMQNCSAEINEFIEHVDSRVFLAVPACASPMQMLAMVFKNFSPWSAIRFIQDRTRVAKSMTPKPLSPNKAKSLVADFLDDLEQRLSKSRFLFGDNVCIADFSAYHVVWFARTVQGEKIFASRAKLSQWFQSMAGFGHGKRIEIANSEVFDSARDNEPRTLTDNMQQGSLVGRQVEIKPDDYAADSVVGTLVGSDDLRWVLLRETNEFGKLHVHFPKAGFELVEQV